jgi:hypothetical protein
MLNEEKYMNELIIRRVANGYIVSEFHGRDYAVANEAMHVFKDLKAVHKYLVEVYEKPTA